MPRLKNISGGRLAIPDRPVDVEDGEIVDLPDVQADGKSPVTYSAAHWEPVTDSKAKAAKDDSGKAAS